MSERKVFVGGEFIITDTSPSDIFTPEDFTKEHKMFYETAIDFIQNEVIPNMEALEEKDFELQRKIHAKAGELGLLGTDVPEEYGGLGTDKVSTCCVGDAMGRAGSYCVTHGAHTGIGVSPIVYFGNDEQKKKYLPKLASGEWIGCSCLTEPGAGSDAMSVRTSAKPTEDGKHYILNGEKIFITNAGIADTFIVYAKVNDKDFTCFVVEKGTPGLSIGKEEKKMGGHGSSTCPVVFEDVKIPVENRIFEVGQGYKSAFNCLNIGRIKLGFGTTGGAKQCVTEAVKYAIGREQFDKKISSFGMIQEKIANMTIKSYMSDSVQYRIAGMLDDKLATLDADAKKDGEQNSKAIGEYATECSISKIFGSETLDYCVDEYVQILGGYGYCSEYPAERSYRDSRINRIWEGTNEINRMLIPGTLMKRAMQGRLNLLGASQTVTAEIMNYSPMSVQLPDTPLALQEHMVSMSKKIGLMTSGVAAMKYQQKLIDEQEVLAILADIVTEVFVMESGVLRTQKIIEKDGEEAAKYQIAAVKAYVDETIPKIEQWAKRMIAYVEDGDMLRTQFASIKKLARYQPIDTITLKKEIAERVIDLEAYPFFNV
ncbi:MAG: acyl-CoA dehydrogenase [Deltaproteobacteria bacterium]|nr:acyl-CoA dehydrogenase [Deltaproteobacteria bacterium]